MQGPLQQICSAIGADYTPQNPDVERRIACDHICWILSTLESRVERKDRLQDVWAFYADWRDTGQLPDPKRLEAYFSGLPPPRKGEVFMDPHIYRLAQSAAAALRKEDSVDGKSFGAIATFADGIRGSQPSIPTSFAEQRDALQRFMRNDPAPVAALDF